MHDKNINEFLAYSFEILDILAKNFTIKQDIFIDDLILKLSLTKDKHEARQFIIGTFELLKTAKIISYKEFNGHCFLDCSFAISGLFLLKADDMKAELERFLFQKPKDK